MNQPFGFSEQFSVAPNLEAHADFVHYRFLSEIVPTYGISVAIFHQIRQKYKTSNEEIVAGLFESAGAVPPTDPEIVIKRKAAEISQLMALVHGGDWRVEIDHQTGFVLIAPRVP